MYGRSWSFSNSQSTQKSPSRLQARFISRLIILQLRIDEGLASKSRGLIHIKIDHPLKEIDSRAPGSILVKTNPFLIKNQLRNDLESSRIDFDQNWSFLDQDSIEEWLPELQDLFWLNLIMF